MSGGWGVGPWGLGSWGLGLPALAVDGALAVSEREVVIYLTTAPQRISPIRTGDALNPQTWVIVNGDTGDTLTVLSVREINSTTFEVYLLQLLGSYLVTHTVSAPTLLDPSGSLISTPNDAEFFGCSAEQPASTEVGLVDLKNPWTSQDALSGTLLVGSDGDYATESGLELIRKLLIRRLISVPGEWFYDTGYGLGVRVKEPLRTADVNTLQAEAQRQVRMEPELSGARVRVIPDAKRGSVTFIIDAKLRRSNRQVTLSIPAPVTSSVVL